MGSTSACVFLLALMAVEAARKDATGGARHEVGSKLEVDGNAGCDSRCGKASGYKKWQTVCDPASGIKFKACKDCPSCATVQIKADTGKKKARRSPKEAQDENPPTKPNWADTVADDETTDPSAETEDTCARWDNVGRLGKGANGVVYKVQKDGKGKAQALKMSLKKSANAEIEEEVKVMKAAEGSGGECQGNIMTVTDDKPCFKEGTGHSYKHVVGYVSPMMKGSLQDWLDDKKVSEQDILDCRKGVMNDVYQALSCLHESGYIHGDLKPDNIYYEDLDDAKCPTGVRLADFGLSYEKDTQQWKYADSGCRDSTHLPGGLFQDCKYTLPVTLSASSRYWTASPDVDMCSFLSMMNKYFLGLEVGNVFDNPTVEKACFTRG